MNPPPLYIVCSPLDRHFPAGWKDVWFGRHATTGSCGVPEYTCPICQRNFDHTYIDELHGDHIWPYSLFGDTSWSNYRLICAGCNLRKSNHVDAAIRRILPDRSFRQIVQGYLIGRADAGLLADPVFADITRHT